MFDFLKNKSANNKNESIEEPALDGAALFRLMRHFPIGARLQYYPEYRKEIMLDSVVIGYVFNEDFVYSALNVAFDERSGRIEFDDQNTHKVYSKISRFRILLPVFTQSENKLDYMRREELTKVGGLVKGNVITMIAEQVNGQLPVLETVVEKRVVLKEGYYADQTIALLEVDLQSLLLTDQRACMRLKTHLPATMQVAKRGLQELVNCYMEDFSDRSLRLVMEPEFSEQALPKVGDDLVIAFNLPGHSEQITLIAEAFRAQDRTVVANLKGMVRKGQVTALGQMEILKIKANLLQHSNTNLAK